MLDLSVTSFPMLSLLVFLPLVGAFILCLPGFATQPSIGESAADNTNPGAMSLPGMRKVFDRFSLIIASCFSFLSFVVALLLLAGFNPNNTNYQFLEKVDWIKSFGVSYCLGLDSLALVLVLLTTVLMPLAFLSCASASKVSRAYLANMLLLETAILGSLLALDVFLFYVFWEMMLIPMYFIIGIWGGPKRIYASIKFVLYTASGSVLMFVGIFFVVWQYAAQQNEVTFFLPDLIQYTNLTFKQEIWLFLAFALAFGIKIPLFPLHTWLPDAHAEAPTSASVVLAGVMLKLGLFGFLRYAYPLFPRAAEVCAPYLVSLAVMGAVYGALLAWSQSDMKRLVAYSSISHLGLCMLGLVAFNLLSITGCIFQMLSHGIVVCALFLLVGFLYERMHTRQLGTFSGLASRMPCLASFFFVFIMAALALPLSSGFVGDFFILMGGYSVWPRPTIVALLLMVFGVLYLLGFYMKTMLGELNYAQNSLLHDLNFREWAILFPLVVLVLVLGIYPRPLLNLIEPGAQRIIITVKERAEALRLNEEGTDASAPASSPRLFDQRLALDKSLKGDRHDIA